jgi:hypothetical protein
MFVEPITSQKRYPSCQVQHRLKTQVPLSLYHSICSMILVSVHIMYIYLMYLFIYLYLFICLFVYIFTVFIYLFVCLFIYLFIYLLIYWFIYLFIHICIYTYINIYIYIYTYTPTFGSFLVSMLVNIPAPWNTWGITNATKVKHAVETKILVGLSSV